MLPHTHLRLTTCALKNSTLSRHLVRCVTGKLICLKWVELQSAGPWQEQPSSVRAILLPSVSWLGVYSPQVQQHCFRSTWQVNCWAMDWAQAELRLHALSSQLCRFLWMCLCSNILVQNTGHPSVLIKECLFALSWTVHLHSYSYATEKVFWQSCAGLSDCDPDGPKKNLFELSRADCCFLGCDAHGFLCSTLFSTNLPQTALIEETRSRVKGTVGAMPPVTFSN